MENWRSSSCTRGRQKKNQPFCRKIDSSLPVNDRTAKTNLSKSDSSKLLQTNEKMSSYECVNFCFAGFDKDLLKNSFFIEFLSKVNCPFCLTAQSDQTILIKHLYEYCTMKMKKRYRLYVTFQIFPNNAIKCNVCSDIVLTNTVNYFSHLYNKNHILKCSEVTEAGKEFTDLSYCTCCKMLVSNDYTQLQSHMQHKIHEVRRKSSFKSDHFLSKGISCVYGFHNGNKRFKCFLCCPIFQFSTPWEISYHFKSSNHKRNVQKNNFSSGVYCCFCDERISEFEIQQHFSSDDHLAGEKMVTSEGNFELCMYCGFVCKTLKDLFAHMKLNCHEINRIREQKGWKMNKDSKKKTKKGLTSGHKLEKTRCILVKYNASLSKLLKILKKFGGINCVKMYNYEYLIVEFRNEASVESLLLVQGFIKNLKGVEIKFLEKEQVHETDISTNN